MNKTLLIIKHEFRKTIRGLAFIILTFALPIVALTGILIYNAVAGGGGEAPPELTIGYVDKTEDKLFANATSPAGTKFILYQTESDAKDDLLAGEISEYLFIPPDYLDTGIITRYTMEREMSPPEGTIEQIKIFLVSNLLAQEEISPEIIERVETPLMMQSLRLDEAGNPVTGENPFTIFGLPYIFAILLIVSIFTMSGYILQGVGEEKENRVIEVLLSSVSARQLLTGKVLGRGAAGLLQILVWVGAAWGIISYASATFAAGISVPPNMLILAIVYFVLGYLLFAALYACVGAIFPSAREASSWSAIFTVPAVLPLMLSGFIINQPEHIIVRVFTIFPLTSPIMTVMRLGITEIPAWELAASIGVLAISIVVAMWLAAKLFRTGLLMYGKRPSFKEIARAIREA